jgi:hypothetical protein
MTTSKSLLTSGNAITITLASLASAAYRQSTVIDNTTNLYLDAMVQLSIKTGSTGTSATGTVSVYVYGSANTGTNYTDGASGSDAAMTPTSPTNLKLIGIINAVANATTYTGNFNVGAAFGGYLPGKWGIVIFNNTGHALDTTEGNHTKVFEALQIQSA